MKAQILLSSTVVTAFISSPGLAASQIVTIDDLSITNGQFTIQVPAGDGVAIDLSEVGQIVKGASFGDATKFVISGIDGQLCYMQQDKCEATGASVFLFRQVKGISIPTQSHSPDGSTTVTLTTEGRLGRKVLHMRLIPAVKATHTAIVVRENPIPALPVVANNTSTQPRLVSAHANTTLFLERLPTKPVKISPMAGISNKGPARRVAPSIPGGDLRSPAASFTGINATAVKPVLKPSVVPRTRESKLVEQPTVNSVESPISRPLPLMTKQIRSDANALAMGLSMANPNRNNTFKIVPRSSQYKKVQSAIVALRRGRSLEEAAEASGLELQFIEQLIYLGRDYALYPSMAKARRFSHNQ